MAEVAHALKALRFRGDAGVPDGLIMSGDEKLALRLDGPAPPDLPRSHR